MFRFKLLIGLAGIFAVLAVSATPALAEFQAKGQWKGVVKVINSGHFTYKQGTETFKVECPSNEVEAKWSIQSKGQIKQHEKEGKQVQVKTGPQLHINVLKWGGHCTAFINKTEIKQVEVTPCELQILQLKGSLKGTGAVTAECSVKAGGCVVTIPQGQEKSAESGEGNNVGLEEIKLKNSKGNLFALSEVTGISAFNKNATKLCIAPTGSGTAELRELEVEIEGVEAI